jgi:hypothetical protein
VCGFSLEWNCLINVRHISFYVYIRMFVEMVFLISDHARQQYGSAYIDTTLIRRIRRNSLAVGSTTTDWIENISLPVQSHGFSKEEASCSASSALMDT